MANSLHILDKNMLRSKQLHEPRNSDHQLILRILATGVIIEVRMALAWRTGDDEIQSPYLRHEVELGLCSTRANISVNDLL